MTLLGYIIFIVWLLITIGIDSKLYGSLKKGFDARAAEYRKKGKKIFVLHFGFHIIGGLFFWVFVGVPLMPRLILGDLGLINLVIPMLITFVVVLFGIVLTLKYWKKLGYNSER